MESSERVAAVQNEQKKQPLYYGSRKTGKFVRCYQKSTLGVDRVELELHSGLLRNILTLDDFLYLPDTVYPKHLQFVEFDWKRLEQHLSRRPADESSRIIAGAKRRAASIRRVRRYLQKHGVANVHRFLAPLAMNHEIRRALDRWARHFKEGSLWAKKN
jgi:ribosomal protein S15P/S13E